MYHETHPAHYVLVERSSFDRRLRDAAAERAARAARRPRRRHRRRDPVDTSV